MTELQYMILDVFTDEIFSGNPLAVVFNADHLSGTQMQKIAAEFNLSETTFISQPKNSHNDYNIRIFTPKDEMPFAGHPNVGTAIALMHYYKISAPKTWHFEEKAGVVVLNVENFDDLFSVKLKAPIPLELGETITPLEAARTCGLAESQIVTSNHMPQMASGGAGFYCAEVKSMDALRQAYPVLIDPAPKANIMIYCRPANSYGNRVQLFARMFAPHSGIMEDPATGSAAVALGGLLSSLNHEETSFEITQGVEMGRPSKILVDVEIKDGKYELYLAGSAVVVMKGQIIGSIE